MLVGRIMNCERRKKKKKKTRQKQQQKTNELERKIKYDNNGTGLFNPLH